MSRAGGANARLFEDDRNVLPMTLAFIIRKQFVDFKTLS